LDGGELPAGALAKVSEAQIAINKLVKSVTGTIANLREVRDNGLAKKSYGDLADDLKALKSTEGVLEGIRVLGELEDGSPAGCSGVLKVLGVAADLMDKSWTDSQAAQGLLSGLKRI